MTSTSLMIRVDDRLIHGQVLVGWASHFPLKRIIVGNDEIADNEWERNLLLMAAPDSIEATAISIDATYSMINDINGSANIETLVLLNGPQDLARLANLGLAPCKVNFGGIHFDIGRTEYLPYIFLTQAEVELCRKLIARGFILECQDLPTNSKYDLASILEDRS